MGHSLYFLRNAGVFAIALAAVSAPVSAQNTIITADKMIDVLTGKTVDYPAVFVGADGRITSIADARTVKWGSDVTHINLSGKTILPGLIDMHVHLESETNPSAYLDRFTKNPGDIAYQALVNAKKNLMAGFTTVRDLGGTHVVISLRNAINKGLVEGPRIFTAGVTIGTTGGHADDTNGINEQWGSGLVAGSNRGEDVIVKYSGQLTAPVTGTISLHAPADDGVRVVLDGTTVINDWYDKGGGGSTRTYDVVANDPMDFILWYYENGGGAWVQFFWNLGQGNVIVPGSAFTQSSATLQQLSDLATAEATLTQEQDELEVLDLQEDVAQQNLLGAQQNLVAAQDAVTAMETAVINAQTAITETVEAIAAVQTAQVTVQQEVILQSPIGACLYPI